MKTKKYWILFLIVLLGFVLRIVYLDKYPPSPNWDEVSHGHNAYSVLKTGKDEWGKFLPLSNFRAYGDYPLALNLYLTIPFIWAFGLNVFSIRLPHVILGTLTIISSYFLIYGITKSKKVSLLAALFMAVEPWSFFLSRFVVQANLSIFFMITAMALFFNREKNKYFLPLTFLFLGFTLFSYHTTRIVTPPLLIIMFVVYGRDINNTFLKNARTKLVSVIFLAFVVISLIFILLNPESRARSSEVFLLDQGAVNLIEQKRNSSDYPVLIKRVIYNRPVYFISEAIKNHIGYFTPRFLFFKGGTQYQFSIPDRGLLYLVNLPFFYYGVYLAFRKAAKKDKNYIFLLLWFLISPVAGSITKENYAVLRATPMLPLPQLFSAMGFFAVYEILSKKQLKYVKIFGLVYFIFLLLCTKSYLSDYFNNYTKNYSQEWQYGYKEVVDYSMRNHRSYEKIIVTKKYGEPHEFFLFFTAWDPEKYRNDPNLIRFYQSNWYWTDSFDKFFFVNDWQIPETGYDFMMESGGKIECGDCMCLLITSPGNVPEGWFILETVYFLNDKPAFEIYNNSFRSIGLNKKLL